MSLIGAMGLLFMTGERISIFSLIGVIMLMGLVTKNAILLVDYTITLRQSGNERAKRRCSRRGRSAPADRHDHGGHGLRHAADGAEDRAKAPRPRAPMAIAVIGGLITSTLLTLVVIPVVYTIVDDLENFFKKKREIITRTCRNKMH